MKLFWVALYALICAAEFLLGWAKDHVEERIKGERPKDPKEGESR